MKQIVKNPEPIEFTEWKTSWTDVTPGWYEFIGSPIKQIAIAAFIEEQGGLCCYCESHVGMGHGHIEHLRAKSKPEYAHLVLAYDNLFYSCQNNQAKNDSEEDNPPQTCGHAKGDKPLLITPLDNDCEQRFIYTITGAIVARDENDNDAIQTIKLLKLEHKEAIFRKDRAKTFQSVEDARQVLTSAEFDLWIDTVLKRQSNGMFKPFWTTIKYAAGLYE